MSNLLPIIIKTNNSDRLTITADKMHTNRRVTRLQTRSQPKLSNNKDLFLQKNHNKKMIHTTMKPNKCQLFVNKPSRKFWKESCERNKPPRKWLETTWILDKNHSNKCQSTLMILRNCMNVARDVVDNLMPMWSLSMRRSAKKCSNKKGKSSILLNKENQKLKDSTYLHRKPTPWIRPKSQPKRKIRSQNGNSKVPNWELD